MELSPSHIAQQAALPRVEAFASFLLNNYLQEYTIAYMHLLKQHGIDTDSYFPSAQKALSTEERFLQSSREYLVLFSKGQWDEQVRSITNQIMPFDTTAADQLKAHTERLFLIGHIFKMACKQFIVKYTQDITAALALVEEIDYYCLFFEKTINDAYLRNMGGLLDMRETLYKEAQSMAHIGNWSLDVEAGKVHYSEEVSHICGFDDLNGHITIDDVESLLLPEDWEELWQKYFRLRHNGRPLFYIATLRLKNGKERIVELKARNAKNTENGRQLVGTIQDVTIEQGMIRMLRENERLYRHTEAMANIGSWSLDLNTERMTFSEGLFRIYELDPHTGIVDMAAPRSYADPEDRKNIDYFAQRCKKEGIRYELQYWITLPTGNRKLLHCIGEAVYDANGQRYGMIGTIRDITQEQDMIQQLRQNELLYKQAQAIGRIGNWVTDLHTRKTIWSEELYHIFEVNVNEKGARRKAAERVLPADKLLLEEHIRRCSENGLPYDCQYRVRMHNDTIRHFRSKGEGVRDKNGALIQLIGTVQDITEQVLVEMRLRDHQRFTQKITDIAPSLIAVYDVHTGTYVFISMAFEKMFGYKRETLLAQGLAFLLDKIHPDDLVQIQKKQTEALNRANNEHWEGIEEFKYRLRHEDGTYRWLQTYGTIFQRDEHGKVLQVLNISIDITGEKMAEQALNQKNVLLQQSNSSLEEFAYIASHDLQEPLRKISTFGNMLQTLQEENLSDSGKLYLRKIVDSSIRMQAMINDLLSVSVISGNRSFKEENLQLLLEEVLVTMEYKIEQTGAVIEQMQPLPHLKVIASQLRQLFQNLISNSLKFMHKEVRPVLKIEVAYMSGQEPELLALTAGRSYLKLRFSDNGIGFSNDYAGKIFAIFQRLHGKAEYEGTGIGLAVCKKIAEHHNGMIYAMGEVNKGAIFTIILPIS